MRLDATAAAATGGTAPAANNAGSENEVTAGGSAADAGMDGNHGEEAPAAGADGHVGGWWQEWVSTWLQWWAWSWR